MSSSLLRALTDSSQELQRSERYALAAGRNDIAQQIRRASWHVSVAIEQLAHEMSGQERTS